jgi:anti-anti-sigma factor
MLRVVDPILPGARRTSQLPGARSLLDQQNEQARSHCLPEAAPMPAPSLLSMTVIPDGERTILVARGEVDLANAHELGDRITAIWDDGCRDVLLNLRGVTFMDSTGLHALIKAHRRATRDGGRFAITKSSHAVNRLLELSVLDQVLVIVPDAVPNATA